MRIPFPHALSRPVSPLVLATGGSLYLGGLLNAPVFHRRLQTGVIDAGALLMELALVLSVTFLIVYLLSLASRPLFRCLMALMLVCSAIASYYATFYNVVIGHGIVESVFTTEMDLINEVAGFDLHVWVLLLGVLPGLYVWRATRTHHSILHAGRRRREALTAIVLLGIAALAGNGAVRSLDAGDKRKSSGQTNDLPDSASLVAHRYLPSNWISGLGMSLASAWQQQVQARTLASPAEQYAWSMPPQLKEAVIVLVIGETARWDHLSPLGYARRTMPRLETEENLVALRGEACDTATALSLRCMFVRPEGFVTAPGQPGKAIEDNVFSVFRSLGFSIELFAMQAEVGFYNRTHADHYKIREEITAEPYNAGKSIDDILLVREMKASIERWEQSGRKQPHLVILHTKGSHYQYSKRHPREFAVFQPECLGDNRRCSRDELINSYDNSILYTDHVLHEVIDTLRDRKAFMFYVSDHGESIDDDLHFHGTPKAVAPKEQLAVPFLLWFSQSWLADAGNARRHEALKSASGAVRPHTDIFDSLLGCAGILSPDGGINPQRNWCRP